MKTTFYNFMAILIALFLLFPIQSNAGDKKPNKQKKKERIYLDVKRLPKKSATPFFYDDKLRDSVLNKANFTVLAPIKTPYTIVDKYKLPLLVKWIEEQKGGADCIRYEMIAPKEPVYIGREFEIKIHLTFETQTPAIWREFGCNKFTLQVVKPDGFIQTGGNYTDLMPFELDFANKTAWVVLRGIMQKEIDNTQFMLLSGPLGANTNSTFLKKKVIDVAFKGDVFKDDISKTNDIFKTDKTQFSKSVSNGCDFPTPQLWSFPDANFLANQSIQLLVLNSFDCPGTISWSDNFNNSYSGISIEVFPIQTTTYTATCISNDELCLKYDSKTITLTSDCELAELGSPAYVRAIEDEPTWGERNLLPIAQSTSKELYASGCYNEQIKWSTGQTGTSIAVIPTQNTTYSTECFFNNCEKIDANLIQKTTIKLYSICGNISAPTLTLTNENNEYVPLYTITPTGCSDKAVWYYRDINDPDTPIYYNLIRESELLINPSPGLYYAACIENNCTSPLSSPILIEENDILQPDYGSTLSIIGTLSGLAKCGERFTLTIEGCQSNSIIYLFTTSLLYRQIVYSGNSTTIDVNPSSTGFGNEQYEVACIEEATGNVAIGGYRYIGIDRDSQTKEIVPFKIVVSKTSSIICSGGSSTLSTDGCYGSITWQKSLDGINWTNLVETTESIAVSPSELTFYRAKCVSTNCDNPFSDSISVDFSLNALVLDPPTISASKTLICQSPNESPESTILTATGCAGDILWSIGATGNSLTIYPESSGTYTAICKSGNCESSDSNLLTITLGSRPTAPVISTDKVILASNENATLTATGCSGSVVWSNEMSGSSISVTTISNLEITAICVGEECASDNSNQLTISSCSAYTPVLVQQSIGPYCTGGKEISLIVPGNCPTSNILWRAERENGTTITNEVFDTQWGNNEKTVKVTQNTIFKIQCLSESCESEWSNEIFVEASGPGIPTITGNLPFDRGGSFPLITTCKGEEISLTASGCASGSTYNWYISSSVHTGTSLVLDDPMATYYSFYSSCTLDGCESQPYYYQINLQNRSPAPNVVTASASSICPGESVTLKFQSYYNYGKWSDGVITPQQYSPEDGNYMIKRVVSPTETTTYYATQFNGADGCEGYHSNSVTITVKPVPPTPIISKSPAEIYPGQIMTLSVTNAESGYTTNWSTSETGTSIDVSPTVATTYTAQFSEDGCTSSTGSIEATVFCDSLSPMKVSADKTTLLPYVPDTDPDYAATLTAEGCVGGIVKWTVVEKIGSEYNQVSYFTSTPDANGVSVLTQRPQGGPTDWGYYTAQCLKEDCISPANPSSMVRLSITYLNCLPPSGYTASNGATSSNFSNFEVSLCEGESTDITAIGCTGVAEWQPIVNSEVLPVIFGNTITVTPTTTFTRYYVRCVNEGCTSESSNIDVLVILNQRPYTPTLSIAKTDYCVGEGDITITASGCYYGHVKWSNGTQSAYTDAQDVYLTLPSTEASTTTYTAICEDIFCESLSSNEVTITIHEPFTISSVTISGVQPTAIGGSFTLSATVTPAGTYTYLWKGPNGFTSTLASPERTNVQPVDGGTYTVTVTNGGCTETATIEVTISESCACSTCDSPTIATTYPLANPNFTNTSLNNIVKNIYLQPTDSIPTGDFEVSQNITYHDGLGRPLQSISIGISPNGKDIVEPIEYDAFGRQVKTFLPYEVSNSGNNGAFRTNAIGENYASSEQSLFYNSLKSDGKAFAETEYEISPFNTVLRQGSVGNDWQLDKTATVKQNYRFNSKTDIKKITYDYENSTWKVENYGLNELYVAETKDEADRIIEEYTDVLGQSVCKIVYNGTNYEDALITYNAFDDFGRLRIVFQPKASDNLRSFTGNFNPYTNASYKELIFWYDYDARGRMIRKKVPGTSNTNNSTYQSYLGEEEYVFNRFNQVVLYRSGQHKAKRQWLYTKYDEQGRIVRSGLFTITEQQEELYNNRAKLQEIVTADWNSAAKYGDEAFPAGNSSNVVFDGITEIGVIDVYTKNLYDNYEDTFFTGKTTPVTPPTGKLNFADLAPDVKGSLTGTWEKVIKHTDANATTNSSIVSVMFYDEYMRVIQTRSTNHTHNTSDLTAKEDITWVEYDFIGREAKSYSESNFRTETNDLTTTTSLISSTYDVGGRIKAICQQLNDGKKEPVARYNYYENGELKEKILGCDIQKIKYETNIRGWLTAINNPATLKDEGKFFGLNLTYDSEGLGLIDSQEWGSIPKLNSATDEVPPLRKYTYHYDALDRLTAATYSGGVTSANEQYDVHDLTYDKNGNITAMKRTINGVLQDDLTYFYANANTNLLVSVNESSSGQSDNTKPWFRDTYVGNTTLNTNNSPSSPNETGDYNYDEAGNLTKDLNKKILSVTYNALNLAEKVTVKDNNDATQTIYYYYTGSGIKIRKQNYDNKKFDYVDGNFYTDNKLEYVPTAEGRALPPVIREGSLNLEWRYEYQIKDHLGNLRVAIRCGDPKLSDPNDPNSTIIGVEGIVLVQENHYDPWGLNLQGIEKTGNLEDRWQFNAQTEKGYLPDGTFEYETDFRMYDAQIGRFKAIDLLADESVDTNPFHFGYNNPITYNDPTGLFPANVPWGLIGAGYGAGIGYAIDGKKGAMIGAAVGFAIGDIGGYYGANGYSVFLGGWQTKGWIYPLNNGIFNTINNLNLSAGLGDVAFSLGQTFHLYPKFYVDEGKYNAIYYHHVIAFGMGKPQVLTYEADSKLADKKRAQVMNNVEKTMPSEVSKYIQRDEYPYASTKEGGVHIVTDQNGNSRKLLPSIMYVPANQNSAHGNDLGKFYDKVMGRRAGKFRVVLRPSKKDEPKTVPVPVPVPKPIYKDIRKPSLPRTPAPAPFFRFPVLPIILNPEIWFPEIFKDPAPISQF